MDGACMKKFIQRLLSNKKIFLIIPPQKSPWYIDTKDFFTKSYNVYFSNLLAIRTSKSSNTQSIRLRATRNSDSDSPLRTRE